MNNGLTKVTKLDHFDVKKYCGAHEEPFKSRIYGHRTNMRHRHQKGTGLSKYIWKLKDNVSTTTHLAHA